MEYKRNLTAASQNKHWLLPTTFYFSIPTAKEKLLFFSVLNVINLPDVTYAPSICTTPEEFENAGLFLRFGLPTTLVCHENAAF